MVNMEKLNDTCHWIVEQEEANNGVKLHKPESGDHPWNMAMLVLMVPPEKQEEFAQKAMELAETYRKPQLKVV